MSTKDRLLDATQELLWEKGYAATSPRDVLTAAGAGQGSMYHHFRGKKDLAAAALDRGARAMRSEAEAALHGPGTALARLEDYLLRRRDPLRGCRMGRMTYDPDVLATPELLAPVGDALDWLVATVAQVVDEAARDGDLDPGIDPRELASTIVAVVQGGYVLARARHDATAFDAAVRGAVTLLRDATP